MTTSTAPPPSATADQPVRQRGDRIFAGLARGAGVLILVVLAGVAAFLLIQAIPAFVAPTADLPNGQSLSAYIAPLVFGTLLSSIIALIIGTPLGVAVALFITHYAPRKLAQGLSYVVDLLAAVPSIIFGLWGANTLAPASLPLSNWLYEHLGWLPFFAGPVSATGRTMLVLGLTLAVMILPIITAVSREVFLQTPKLHEEAALALGATRWEMIRMAVLPFGRSGIISGAMLGLGRALGETMAVAIILSASRRRHVQPDQLGQPVDDRGQHRPAVPGLHRPLGERAHRVRPGAVRDHAAGQRDSALDRQPSARVLGGELMTLDTQKAERTPEAVPPVLAKRGELPRWAPWAILVATLVVVGGLLAVTGFSIGLWLSASAVVYAIATYAVSRGVEGRRKATDRLVTIVVTVAFLLALVPLVSVIAVVVENGLARFDAAFFTQSMRGVVGEGGGGYHAIMGTLIITALAAVMSIPDRPAHRGLPRGVRPGQACAGDHVLRRRHDRHPVDRRGSVRVRPVRAVPRAVRAHGASWARWRCRC